MRESDLGDMVGNSVSIPSGGLAVETINTISYKDKN
jgi:hypothetical protein